MQLGTIITVITVMLNLIFLISKAYPFRWIAVGLSFMILFTIYPIIFTIYVAFTNYGDGHLLTKEMVIEQLRKQYTYQKLENPTPGRPINQRRTVCFMVGQPATGKAFLAKPGEEILPAKPGDPGIGAADAKGIPRTD